VPTLQDILYLIKPIYLVDIAYEQLVAIGLRIVQEPKTSSISNLRRYTEVLNTTNS
jgi:hypothetical protein